MSAKAKILTCPKASHSPQTVAAMQYLEVSELPLVGDWFSELKWNGLRAIAAKEGTETGIYAAPGESLADRFPSLRAALATLRCKSAVIDGEIQLSATTVRRHTAPHGRRLPTPEALPTWFTMSSN